jgi:hypothetical protein
MKGILRMDVSKDSFAIPRTPYELEKYVEEAYKYIYYNSEKVKKARLKKEPYKTFIEELLPFSIYCKWKYGNNDNFHCSWAPGTEGKDGVVKDLSTGNKRLVEITWPIDGKKEVTEGDKINENRMSSVEIWDGDDTSKHKEAIGRVLKKAYDKSLIDYTADGGSSLIFVFNEYPLFYNEKSKHADLLSTLKESLKKISFQVDDVILIFMPSKRLEIVKGTEQTRRN